MVTLSHFNRVTGIRQRQGGIEVQTAETATPGEVGVMGHFEFSPDFELTKARWSDGYAELHKALEREGKIDHPWEKCPDRAGPRLIRAWNPQRGWTTLHLNARTSACTEP